jgi:hypothetical protein
MAELLNEINDGNQQQLDLLDAISDDDQLPPAWDPESAGDGIQGIVVQRTSMNSKFHEEPVPVVVVETADGDKRTVYGSRTRSRAEIDDNDPQPGDLFAIKYLGERQRKDASGTYHHYRAAVRRGVRPDAGEPDSKPPPF